MEIIISYSVAGELLTVYLHLNWTERDISEPSQLALEEAFSTTDVFLMKDIISFFGGIFGLFGGTGGGVPRLTASCFLVNPGGLLLSAAFGVDMFHWVPNVVAFLMPLDEMESSICIVRPKGCFLMVSKGVGFFSSSWSSSV